MGPEMLGLCPWPEMDPDGDCAVLDLNGVMDWETPEARVNCSRSSTLVRPLAANTHKVITVRHTPKEINDDKQNTQNEINTSS